MIIKKYITKIVLATSFGLVASCNTRYLQEGQMLYTGADLEIKNDTISKKQKKELKAGIEGKLTPKPNSSFLGLRPKLWVYNLTAKPNDTVKGGIRKWLQEKFGEEPVLLQDVDLQFNRDLIVNYSENKGYFNATAKYDTLSKNKKAKVLYTLNPKARYIIKNVDFAQDSTLINQNIRQVAGKSYLKTGNPFDLDVIKAERERIDNQLKERGFYYFHADNIIVQADSTISENHKVDLTVKLKDNTPKLAKEQFSIDKVVVFPDYSIQDVKEGKYHIPMSKDSLSGFQYQDIFVVDYKNKFKPRIFDRALYFKPGDVYNRANHNLTLNRLIGLGVFKFVKNEFVISDSLNNKFDVYYLLTPQKFQSLRLETLGKTNSANYAGSEVNLNWVHRNIFRGAEQLKISTFGGFDVQMGGRKEDNNRGTGNIFRLGGKAEISIPRIIAPFKTHSSSAFVPRTYASLSYEYMNRTRWYTLNSFSANYGYTWKENIRKEHDLKVMDIAFVRPSKITPVYDSIQNANQYLKRVTERQLVFGPQYTYTYTNTMLPRKTTIYYRGYVDFSANLTGLIAGANVKKDKQKTVFNVPFSQYAKMEHDFRFYHKISNSQTFAARAIAGIAYPYGNSLHIPFSRQFFVGGSNSIRAFRARTLGPGSYDPRNASSQLFFDQAGDVKLELNAEYRANLYKFLNIALFADAGNIWLINEDEERPGAKFSKEWLSEIAVGAGVGLRLDFNILILRLDLAFPIRVPYYDKNDRWMFDKVDFKDSQWRKDNLMLNIAIGYPF